MPLASANPYPYMLYVEQGSTPSSPSSGNQRLFVRSSDHVLCMVNSSGTVTALSGSLTNPMTTAGDSIVGGASGAPTRLAAGTAGYPLVGGGAGVASAYAIAGNFHGAKAYNAGTQTISTGVEAAITFGAEEYDTDAFHDNSTNPSRFTVPVTGYYRLTATLFMASGLGNATLESAMSFYINGTVVRGGSLGEITSQVGAGGKNQVNLTADVNMTASQFAEVKFFNGTSGNVVLGHASAASVENAMSIHLIGI